MVARIVDAVRPFGARTLGNVTKAITHRWKPGDATSQFVGAVSNVATYPIRKRGSLSIVKASTVLLPCSSRVARRTLAYAHHLTPHLAKPSSTLQPQFAP